MPVTYADIFSGAEFLIKNSGERVPAAQTTSGVIGLYFSAHWCGPCRGFTPVLAKIYGDLKSAGKDFEVVFVSGDRDEKSMMQYFAEMPWLALAWEDKERTGEALEATYKCSGIPHLVLLDAATGEVVSYDGRAAVLSGADAFPFTREAIAAAAKRRTDRVVQELGGWSAVGSDVDAMRAHEAVALFVGNAQNNARHVAGALAQASLALGARLKVFFLPHLVGDAAEQAAFEAKFPESWTVVSQPKASELAKTIYETLEDDPDEPLLLIVNPACTEIIQPDACRIVFRLKHNGFPWTEEAVSQAVAEEANKVQQFAARLSEPGLKFLDGAKIVTHPSGASHTLEDLRALDLVGIYFSAHWCPPCRGFTPELAQLYKEVTDAGKKFGVLFVSSDRDSKSFQEYFHEMPWVALDFEQRELKAILSQAFRVEGIPTLVLADPKTGKFSRDGRDKVAEGAASFPWAF